MTRREFIATTASVLAVPTAVATAPEADPWHGCSMRAEKIDAVDVWGRDAVPGEYWVQASCEFKLPFDVLVCFRSMAEDGKSFNWEVRLDARNYPAYPSLADGRLWASQWAKRATRMKLCGILEHGGEPAIRRIAADDVWGKSAFGEYWVAQVSSVYRVEFDVRVDFRFKGSHRDDMRPVEWEQRLNSRFYPTHPSPDDKHWAIWWVCRAVDKRFSEWRRSEVRKVKAELLEAYPG